MIDFLIKSTVALSVFLVFYHLILEREKMHQFNRFYLLFAILISLIIPFVSFEIIKEIPVNSASRLVVDQPLIQTQNVVEDTNYKLIFLKSLYVLVTLILTLRFARNIKKFVSKIKNNPAVDFKNSKLVLVEEKTLPHTFLNYIFINADDYNKQNIEAELYTHELLHATQKHTLDILFVEVLRTVFWFNPIFLFYKKAIQLNHEFLADEKVVKSHNNVSFYQNLILSKANQNPVYYLASNLNYFVTKKRLIMMTTTTSTSRGLFKKTILLPLFTGLVYFLCAKTVAQEAKGSNEATQKTSSYSSYYDNTTFKIKNDNGVVVKEKKYKELTLAEKKVVPNVLEGLKFPPTKEEVATRMEKGGPDTVEIDLYDPKNQKVKKEEGTIYKTTDLSEDPTYPEGIEAFYKFIGQNYKVPVTPADVKLKGRVYISFLVEKDGALTDFKLLRDIGYGTGEEAIRVLKLSQNWIPGKVNGEPVATMYSLPITIQSKE